MTLLVDIHDEMRDELAATPVVDIIEVLAANGRDGVLSGENLLVDLRHDTHEDASSCIEHLKCLHKHLNLLLGELRIGVSFGLVKADMLVVRFSQPA